MAGPLATNAAGAIASAKYHVAHSDTMAESSKYDLRSSIGSLCRKCRHLAYSTTSGIRWHDHKIGPTADDSTNEEWPGKLFLHFSCRRVTRCCYAAGYLGACLSKGRSPFAAYLGDPAQQELPEALPRL